MSIGEVSFFTGILLFFIGIIGGGIDIKEIKIPQITGASRYACFIGSILFLAMGLYLKHELPNISINSTVSNTPAPDVPATAPLVPAQQTVVPVNVPPENAESDKAIAAKNQALVQLNEANKRINSVWNATTQEIRNTLLPEQTQWLKQREEDCALQASTEQPVDTVMQEAVKLNCMTTMNDHRTEELKQKIADITQAKSTDSKPSETETPKNQDINSIASINASSISDVQTAELNKAKSQLDEANKRINSVWNATTQEIRNTLLPEQTQWLKQREEDCSLKASNEQPTDQVMQETFKLNCMATMTDPRTEELKQKIDAMTQ
ncbi:MAG: DUF1311 domain-containing protein [Methylococcaceae bacterium]|nr:DUF1311 domain-containing protein [Methylococcaceae bacterium]